MALLARVYFNAVFGALGGLLGWMLFGVFGARNPGTHAVSLGPIEIPHWQLNALLGGLFIGGAIGYLLVGVEALRDRSPLRFARLASYGVLLGAVGGALGMLVGEIANYELIGVLGPSVLVMMLARGIGWSFLGMAIGVSEGVAARSLGKVSYGTLGGAVGGFVGGELFALFYKLAINSLTTTFFWNALGLVILGACIGSLSALVQAVFQPASVKVMRGWQEGREYPLEKPANLLGRDEHADIALFRDMQVEKKHALIKRVHGQYVLVNNGAPAQNTLVNDNPVPQARALRDGDRIQLGNIILRFQLRAAKLRTRGKHPPPETRYAPVQVVSK
jgi:hypothetical protein